MSPNIRENRNEMLEPYSVEKDELFDLIVKNFPIGLLILNNDGNILEFNPAAEKITGFKKKEIYGKRCHEVLSGIPCHLPEFKETMFADNILVHSEGILRHKDGHEIPVRYTAAPLVKENDVKGAMAVFRDVTKEKQLEQHRRVLISMFAHDLKGPLSCAGGLLLRLQKEKAGPLNPNQRQYVNAALKEVGRVENFIKSFLDIVRMEAGQITLSKELCDLNKLFSDILDSLKIEASRNGIKIDLKIAEDVPLVYVDRTQFQRVLLNLLDNAVKYSPENSIVSIRCTETEKNVMVNIEDSGPGIQEEDLPYIFDPFYRAKCSGNVEGSGIGLAIVKTIVEAHGGKVWVRNKRSPAHGAVFSFSIPKNMEKAPENHE